MNDIQSDRELSERARKVWMRLGARQRELIRKDCPYRFSRNSVLLNLRMRGVPLIVLSELSGLDKGYLCELLRFKSKPPRWDILNLKVEIGRLGGRLARLAAEVARLKEERPKLQEAGPRKRDEGR